MTSAATTATVILTASITRATGRRRPPGGSPEPFDDRGVGHATALAHRLQTPPAAGALELVEQCGHELRAGAAERVADRDRAAVDVHLAHVRVVLLLPREHDRCERLVDLDEVH